MLYCIIFGVILVIGTLLNDEPKDETLGDLNQRFASEIYYEYNDGVYGYRGNEIVNILFIGIDRENLASAITTPQSGGQADMLVLLSVDRSTRTITPVHIDRDTIAEIDIYGALGDYAGKRHAQICLAQAFGENDLTNCENTVKAVSRYLGGIKIDQFLAIDMSGIDVLNDALGGIEVTLESDLSAFDPLMTKGATLTLQGNQAEIFVRSRMGADDGTNQARMVRQRVYMDGALQAFSNGIKNDSSFVGELYDALGGHLITDADRGWLINNAYTYSQYDMNEIRIIAGEHSVGTDGFVEFHADKDALGALLTGVFFEK